MKGECLAGYYCAGANTGSKGQTADTPQAEKKCAKGFFCPPGSTGEKGRLPKKDDTGGTCTTDAHCLCAAGYYCPEGSTTQFGQVIISSSSKNICPAGSYCPEGWYNKLGKPCKVGYYCPEGSTAETGLPGGDNDVAGCDATTGCTCAQGYLCPERSITMYGGQTSDPTAKNECPAGYVCWAPGNKQNHEVGAKPCPKGYYCTIQTHEPKECAAGYFCPETSTTQHGEPLGEKHDGCTPGECKCKAGYYCPSSSSQSEGYPMTGYGVSPRPMTCTPGFWCPETSTTMEGEPHQDEHTGMMFATGPQEVEVQILCIACAADELADGRFATVTDADKAAIRGTCWLHTNRLASFRDAEGNEFPACGGKDKHPSEGGCSLKHVYNLSNTATAKQSQL